MRRLLAPLMVITVTWLSACGHTQSLAEGRSPCRDTHEFLQGLLWVQTAAEYRALTLAAYDRARSQLDAALADPKWTAAVEQAGDVSALPVAVILDLDETVLDNSPYDADLVRAGQQSSDEAWRRWVERAKAEAVPGAAQFLGYAQQRGVAIFYVTNRSAAEEPATRRNLAALGLPVYDHPDGVLCKGERPEWTSDKTSRRQFVAASYRVVLLVGDDLNDFVPTRGLTPEQRVALAEAHREAWSTRWVLLPNPLYGSWETALYPRGSSDEQVLKLKRARIRAAE